MILVEPRPWDRGRIPHIGHKQPYIQSNGRHRGGDGLKCQEIYHCSLVNLWGGHTQGNMFIAKCQKKEFWILTVKNLEAWNLLHRKHEFIVSMFNVCFTLFDFIMQHIPVHQTWCDLHTWTRVLTCQSSLWCPKHRTLGPNSCQILFKQIDKVNFLFSCNEHFLNNISLFDLS